MSFHQHNQMTLKINEENVSNIVAFIVSGWLKSNYILIVTPHRCAVFLFSGCWITCFFYIMTLFLCISASRPSIFILWVVTTAEAVFRYPALFCFYKLWHHNSVTTFLFLSTNYSKCLLTHSHLCSLITYNASTHNFQPGDWMLWSITLHVDHHLRPLEKPMGDVTVAQFTIIIQSSLCPILNKKVLWPQTLNIDLTC